MFTFRLVRRLYEFELLEIENDITTAITGEQAPGGSGLQSCDATDIVET